MVTAVHPVLYTATLGFAANQAVGSRIIVGQAGTLTDLAVYVVSSAGNIDVGVYSTASPRVRLYSTGSIACPAAGAWRIVGSLSLVVAAGDQYDLVIGNDTGTATIGATANAVAAAIATLPAGYLPALGASPLIGWFTAGVAFPLPATIADGAITPNQTVRAVAARIA
jgi:hypothetical protein